MRRGHLPHHDADFDTCLCMTQRPRNLEPATGRLHPAQGPQRDGTQPPHGLAAAAGQPKPGQSPADEADAATDIRLYTAVTALRTPAAPGSTDIFVLLRIESRGSTHRSAIHRQIRKPQAFPPEHTPSRPTVSPRGDSACHRACGHAQELSGSKHDQQFCPLSLAWMKLPFCQRPV